MPGGLELQVVGTELERVIPKVPALFDRDDVFYSSLEKRPVEVISSRDMRIPLELRPNGNTGYYDPDGGDLGRGDISDFDKAVIHSVHLVHRVEMTAKSVWSTDSNRKAVINAFRHALAVEMKQFRRDVDSQCMTDGTGTIGTITSFTTGAGVDTYTCTTDGYGVRLMRSKQKVNVFDTTYATNRTASGASTITFYDLANKQIQVTPAVTNVTNGDKIVADGLTSTPPVGIYGVPYHNNSSSVGTWLGFPRSTTPEIRANRVNAAGSALTLPLPRLAINKIGDRVGIKYGAKCFAWMHKAQQSAYEELGFNAIRIDKAAKEEGLNLYFNDNMQMAGAPLKISYSWDRTRIDFIDQEYWGRGELKPPGMYQSPDDNQRVWEIRGTSGGVATSWVFYYVTSFNIFLNQPAGSSYIDQLAVTSGY